METVKLYGYTNKQKIVSHGFKIFSFLHKSFDICNNSYPTKQARSRWTIYLYDICFVLGLICVLDIDVQGVRSIKRTDLNPNYLFVKPPSLEELEKRLKVKIFILIDSNGIEIALNCFY